jgi:hypothetical protein
MHPLLENYEKYYGKKEEEPKKEELKGIANVSLSKEQLEVLSPYLRATNGTSGIASVSTRSNFINTSNSTVSITQKPKAIKTFDTEYSKDCFLEIAEKIKDHTAKVTSISMNADMVSSYYTGLRTIIFGVQVYDAP